MITDTDTPNLIWSESIETIMSMCIADTMGRGVSKKTLIMNLRLFADQMEKQCIDQPQ